MIDTASIAEVFWFGVALVVFSVIVGVILEVAWTSLHEEKHEEELARVDKGTLRGGLDLPR